MRLVHICYTVLRLRLHTQKLPNKNDGIVLYLNVTVLPLPTTVTTFQSVGGAITPGELIRVTNDKPLILLSMANAINTVFVYILNNQNQ